MLTMTCFNINFIKVLIVIKTVLGEKKKKQYMVSEVKVKTPFPELKDEHLKKNKEIRTKLF